jgi:hypothetical protein
MQSLCVASFLVVVTACASSERNGATLDGGGDAGIGGDVGFGDVQCQTHCSADLHSVVDCNGAAVTQCADDQGCAAGACVSACDSAQANASTVGCDYFTFSPDMPEPGGCFATYVVNTWGSPVTISVDIGGTSLPIAGFARIPSGDGQAITYAPLPGGLLPPNEVAILFLAGLQSDQLSPCPAGVTPATSMGNLTATDIYGAPTSGLGTALHVATDRPVVAYDIWPYGGGNSAITSATLLIPTSAWDTNYVAVDAYDSYFTPHGSENIDIHPWVALIASQNDTSVTLNPTAAVVGGPGVAATSQGVAQTYTFQRGQIIAFIQNDELVGSAIQATKPIGVWGGVDCMNVPDGAQACDSGHQQIPPVKALGHEYVVARYRDRYGTAEWPPVRIVGAVDGTTLTYDPSPPPFAPASLAKGQMVEFQANAPFVIRSQDAAHPFYAAAYMTGCADVSPDGLAGAVDDCRGDPEFVNVIPPQEFLPQYTFFTDPTYPETELVVVRQSTGGNFADVTLDCLGTVTGWQPVDANGTYQFARVDLVTGNFAQVNGCDNGVHQMQSSAPFGLTVWGWGSAASGGTFDDSSAPGFYSQAVSYAYPAGASVQQITNVVVPVN